MGKYNAYEKYKDSGVEWLGEIPEHWEAIRIKFSTYIKGRVGWHGLNSKEFLYEGDFYLVTGTDFKGRTINWESCYRITEERYQEDPYIHLKENDILITKDGTIGKIVQVKNIPSKASVNSGVFVTRPLVNNSYNDDYMFYILTSSVFQEFINIQKSGTTISHLYQNVFENFQYPIPPLPEQQAIANFLDYKTKQIDALITKKETLLKKLDEKRTAIISHAVTKGLDPNVPMKDSGIEWLGEIPEHWEVKRLKQVTKLIDGDRGKNYPGENDLQDEGIPFLSTENIKFNTFDFSQRTKFITLEKFESLSRGKLMENDLVVTMRGTIGQTALFYKVPYQTAFINAQMIIARPTNIFAEFLKYISISVLWTKQLDFYSYGTAQQQLSGAILGILRLGLPPLPEQQAIANFLDHKTKQIDQQKAKIQQAINLLKEYRTALITNAVTGKIDVRQVLIP